MTDRTIKVKALTRVEGEGGLYIYFVLLHDTGWAEPTDRLQAVGFLDLGRGRFCR